MTVIAIDVGATGIDAGYGGWAGRTDPHRRDPTPDSAAALVARLEALVEDLGATARAADRPVDGVGIALPGTLDAAGRLEESLHTQFAGLDLASALGDEIEWPLAVANDTNAQALGCAAPGEVVCYAALGTGVGGAIVEDRELIEGANGFAGEIGHVRVGGSDRDCVCGKTGCLYTAAAGTAVAADLGESWWRSDLGAAGRQRLTDAGAAVGQAAASAAALVDPDRVVVAGHLTDWTPFRDGLSETWAHPFSDCPLETRTDTWPLARAGLTRLIRRDRES